MVSDCKGVCGLPVSRQLDVDCWVGIHHGPGGFQNVGRQQRGRRTALQCSIDHPRDSISLYQFTATGNIHRSASLSTNRFRGLIGFPRRCGVFRADCDRRVVFYGLVQSPHELSTSTITFEWFLRLDVDNVHVPTRPPFLPTTYRASTVI